MTSERRRTRGLERLERLAAADLDVDGVRLEAIEEIARVVGFRRWCFVLADPDALAKHRIAGLETPVRTLSGATGGDLARSRRWDECLRWRGSGDLLTAACRDRHGCWGWIELHRDSDDAFYDDADAAFVAACGAILAGAIRRGTLEAHVDLPADSVGPGVLVLDDELRATSWTGEARAWVELLPGAAKFDEAGIVPAVVAAVASRAATDAGLPPRARARTVDGRWLIVDAARLEGATPGGIVVTLRRAAATDLLEILCRAYELSPREREIVGLLLEGLDTKQLTQRLLISRHTVQDHLKSVFAKVGVHSRRELVTGVLGRAA